MRFVTHTKQLKWKNNYAYRRRACAKVDLKDLKGALDDLKIAVTLEPSDRYNMMGLKDVQSMLAKELREKL